MVHILRHRAEHRNRPARMSPTTTVAGDSCPIQSRNRRIVMTGGQPISAKADLNDLLEALNDDSGPLGQELARLNATALTGSGLDERTAVLVRLAALIALDAAPASYLVHLALAESAKIDPATVRAVLIEVAPVVGTARVVSAADKALRAANTL
jgi:4-carboxymuconolactone decarboxylase